MRIDSSGNVFIGKTSATISTDGLEFASGALGITRNDDTPLFLNRRSSDGSIQDFRKDNTTVGSISAVSSDLAIFSSASSHTGLRLANGYIAPTNNSGTISDNTADLGISNYRFKDLFLSGGIYVGGTGSANHLDDYEEGIWTVSFPMTTSGSYTVRSGYATGYYRKIGNTVTVALRFETQGESSPVGNIQIGGFPFTFTNTDPSGGLESFHYPILLRGYSASDSNMGAFVNPQGGTNNALLYMQNSSSDTGFATVTPSDVANFEGSVCFTYITTL